MAVACDSIYNFNHDETNCVSCKAKKKHMHACVQAYVTTAMSYLHLAEL